MFKFNLRSTIFQDCFSTKYITVQMFDELSGWHVFPLKSSYIQNSNFFLKMGDRMFLMLFDPAAVKTYRGRGVGIVQTILYTTQDWRPIELNDINSLNEFCEKNGIKNIDVVHALLIKAASIIENKETGEKAIPMESVLEVLLGGMDKESDQYHQLNHEYQNAIAELGTLKLIKPINPINKILSARLSNPPENLMTLFTALMNTHFEWRKIANPHKQPFKYWLLLLGILGGTAAAAIAAYLLLGGNAGQPDLLEQIRAASEAGLDAPSNLELGATDDIFESVTNVVTEQIGGSGEQYTIEPATPEPAEVIPEPEPAAPEPEPIQNNNSTINQDDPEWLKEIDNEFN